MSPLQIEILLHYHSRAVDYRDGDLSAPAVQDALEGFLSDKMVRRLGWSHTNGGRLKYALTDRGKAFVEHICSLPLPECQWVMS